MSSQPLVSVVIIFLQAERFLDEAIRSVFDQTYRNWELLLVDDGSTDGSSAIACRWSQTVPDRVRYLEHPSHANRGMSASRNLGVRHARGEYVAFLDADDVWLATKLQQQVDLLAARPQAAMAYSPTQWWYSWTGDAIDQGRDVVHPLGVPPDVLIEPPRLLAHFLANEGDSPCVSSVLIRRAVLQEVGGFEDTFRGLYEDQAFFAKVCLRYPVIASAEYLDRYRQHAESACALAMHTGQARGARLRFLTWLQQYLVTQHAHDAQVWRSLRWQLWMARHPLLARWLRRVGL
jgi:glycosyltransferase involved in cell wall biosynthesis